MKVWESGSMRVLFGIGSGFLRGLFGKTGLFPEARPKACRTNAEQILNKSGGLCQGLRHKIQENIVACHRTTKNCI